MTQGVERPALCTECQSREANSTHRGLCWSCYQKARRAGRFRKRLSATGVIGHCRNCGRWKIIAASGLCWRCYNSKRKTGLLFNFCLDSCPDEQVTEVLIQDTWREDLCSDCPISCRSDWRGAEQCARTGCIRAVGKQIRALQESETYVK